MVPGMKWKFMQLLRQTKPKLSSLFLWLRLICLIVGSRDLKIRVLTLLRVLTNFFYGDYPYLQQTINDPMAPITKHFLKDLWSLQLPAKIKLHMWNYYNNFLPTYNNLHKWCIALNKSLSVMH